MALPNTNTLPQSVSRIRLWYGLLLIVFVVFGLRLFYVQIIRYDYYKSSALSDQLKQYEVPARRGVIKANDNGQLVPIVLNHKLYTLYGDPSFVKDVEGTANKLSGLTGGNASEYAELLATKNSRYVVLAKKVTPELQKKIVALKLPGVGTVAQDYRTYPQGTMAAQILGFVDDSGTGRYGLEEYFNKQLTGKPGAMKAITDIRGVPLASSADNIEEPAVKGDDLVLTLDLAMQQQVETIIKEGVERSRASGGSAMIMDPKTGAVKAMANYPSYDPGQYFNVEKPELFQNQAITQSIEVGSIMKSLTTAAALDMGVINANTSYYDPARWMVDEFYITNVEQGKVAGQRNMADVLNLSLNTGVTWQLMQMGGGSINSKARNAWHDYMVNHYRLGKVTGIEQGYESAGYVPPPKDNGAGINLTYANTAFGQAMTATPVQMAAALSAVLNGGTYYQPRLIDATIGPDGTITKRKPKVLVGDVVSEKVTRDMLPLLDYVVQGHTFYPSFDHSKYTVGGKTGTAQIAKPEGGYYENKFNGSYAGFVGGDEAQYVIVVFIDKPTNGGYAGTAAAQPVFGKIAHMLIDESRVTPKTR